MSAPVRHTLAQALNAAGRVVGRTVRGGRLGEALGAIPAHRPALRAAAQDLAYNTLREYGRVDAMLSRLAHRPIDDEALYGLMLVALTELAARPMHAHATVHQAVEAAALVGRPNAAGLVNALLRTAQRREALLRRDLDATEVGRYRHPQWWIDELKRAYPDRWQALLECANDHPPMTLRVNARRITVERYLARLAEAGIGARRVGEVGVRLDAACRVEVLPGFLDGLVSVQDAGAQRAAALLDVHDGMSVLDACAAPGGKCAHLLERSDCQLVALDVSGKRLSRVRDNLGRLGLRAEIVEGDAAQAALVLGGRRFDRIVLDAPCTASGVVRRHPDLRWQRRAADIEGLARQQRELLDALWQVLRPDGKLLYATCSVFPSENELQVRAFMDRHADAGRLRLAGLDDGQILPGTDTDGFFYALLCKQT